MQKPLVDVVIPSFGDPSWAIHCVESIKPQKRLGHIFVQDDKSPQGVLDVLKNLECGLVTVHQNIQNMGFTSSVNRCIKKNSQAKYVLILNSDTEVVTPNAIEVMAQNLDDGAAACGALLVYHRKREGVAGLVQHAGVMFDVKGFPLHVFSGYHPENPAVQTWRSINAVTGACMMVSRDVWDTLGGFDNRFSPGVFEDIDLCLRVRKLGREVVYEPKSTWFHWEHGSQSGPGWFSAGHIQNNFSILCSKHGVQKCDAELFHRCR